MKNDKKINRSKKDIKKSFETFNKMMKKVYPEFFYYRIDKTVFRIIQNGKVVKQSGYIKW